MADQRHPPDSPSTGEAPSAAPVPHGALLLLDERDSVAVATRDLGAGEVLFVGGDALELRDAIPFGHKVALVAVRSGAPVTKYGEVIGIATVDIDRGAHVHVHNVVSARLPGPGA